MNSTCLVFDSREFFKNLVNKSALSDHFEPIYFMTDKINLSTKTTLKQQHH